MVCELGMSDRLGLVTLHRKGDGDSMFFSELTAADVDAEVKALTDAAYKQAHDILKRRRATLVRIAEHLQVVETIDGDELDRLLGDESSAVKPVRAIKKDATGAARIAAAEVNDWAPTEGPTLSTDDVPPVAAG
jgi:cell division protease FtsH